MLTSDKITEIYCIADDFCKEFAQEIKKLKKLPENGKKRRNRSCEMSDSEIMTVLLLFHFGTFKNFKHYYLHYIGIHLKKDFPKLLSYNNEWEKIANYFSKDIENIKEEGSIYIWRFASIATQAEHTPYICI